MDLALNKLQRLICHKTKPNRSYHKIICNRIKMEGNGENTLNPPKKKSRKKYLKQVWLHLLLSFSVPISNCFPGPTARKQAG